MKTLIAAAVLAALPVTAFAEMMSMDTPLGKVWTDDKGMTLYTFDKDADGVSACYDKCAVNWPPYLAAADAVAEGDWGIVDRTDGTKQWTYDGKPLYLWIKDEKPGDTTGDMVNDVWHAAMAD